jgi:nucleotide-binding universal stress UspA family protein
MNDRLDYMIAMDDFHRQRQLATLESLWGRLTGKSNDLLSFNDVARRLHISGGSDLGLQDIPLDAIVGSVGRYADFTRRFLPRQSRDLDRWARVKSLVTTHPQGLPPIEVYKVGDVYFVKDGHHRVSVARTMKANHIQAYVTEVRLRVPVNHDLRPEDLILKEEYVAFLEQTQMDRLLPNSDLRVSICGAYQDLAHHIQVHQFFMGLDLQRDIPFEEAVKHWYAEVYQPVEQAIVDKGILAEFPGRTPADLYLWISQHREILEKEYGWRIRPDVAAVDLMEKKSPRLVRVFDRVRRRVYRVVVPDIFASTSGTQYFQRNGSESLHESQRFLFRDILIPLSGDEPGWAALDQGIYLASGEDVNLQGLHVSPGLKGVDGSGQQAVRERFSQRCAEAGVQGNLLVQAGDITNHVVERSVLADLVILNVAHPPASQPMARLNSGLRMIIHRSARPILAVPGRASTIEHLLVAYDGSPKAREALFIAAYFACKKAARVTVLSVTSAGSTRHPVPLEAAQEYLLHRKLNATFLHKTGSVPLAILEAVESQQCTMILMGGYGLKPVVEVVLGSSVDQVLQETHVPVLICQ